MSSYLPHTDADIEAMLRVIGVAGIDDLFRHVPEELRARATLDLPPALSEPEVRRVFAAHGARNARIPSHQVFLGGGAYPHDVPAVVDHILRRSEFATAYTPYQAEVSQGTLQSIFEFQTFVSILTGLEVANASMYDGPTAAAEAVLMARRLAPKRRTVLMARAIQPQYRAVIATYLQAFPDVIIREIPWSPMGTLDVDALQSQLGEETLCLLVGHPNVFGCVEDVAQLAPAVHAVGALLVTVTTEALALAALRSPGSLDADVAVGEGQSFGLPVSYGGPGLGLFATRERFVRAMPGRLVGETTDLDGRRGFVLTLATREQHIRRERATSNICTNQGLCALAVTVYLSLLGPRGLQALAHINRDRAARVRQILQAHGCEMVFAAPTFNEFVVRAPAVAREWEGFVQRHGVIPGFPLGRWYPELEGDLLLCATEVHTDEGLQALARALDAHASEAGASC